MPSFANPTDTEIIDLLQRTQTIAVIGLSPNPSRASHGVARAMQRFGYRIVPINPRVDAVLGERAYARLEDVPETIDLVDVFRAPEHVGAIVEQVTSRHLPALWLQLGVVDEAAARRAQDAGITVVMDRCLYQEYLRLLGTGPHTDVGRR